MVTFIIIYLVFGFLVTLLLNYLYITTDKYKVYSLLEQGGMSRDQYRGFYSKISKAIRKHPYLTFGLSVVMSPTLLVFTIIKDKFGKFFKKGNK